MPTVDCGHWNGRRNETACPTLLDQSFGEVGGRRFRLPVEADFHRHPIPKAVMRPARLANDLFDG